MTTPNLGQQVDALTAEHTARSRTRDEELRAERMIPSRGVTNRYTVSNGVATIGSTDGWPDPGEWPRAAIFAAIPGAREAWNDVEETASAGRAAYAEERSTRAAWLALRNQRQPSALSVDVERAQIIAERAARATERAGQNSRRALAAYDDLVTPQLRRGAMLANTAASAVAAHTRVQAARAALTEALTGYVKGASLAGAPLHRSSIRPVITDSDFRFVDDLLAHYRLADVQALAETETA